MVESGGDAGFLVNNRERPTVLLVGAGGVVSRRSFLCSFFLQGVSGRRFDTD